MEKLGLNFSIFEVPKEDFWVYERTCAENGSIVDLNSRGEYNNRRCIINNITKTTFKLQLITNNPNDYILELNK